MEENRQEKKLTKRQRQALETEEKIYRAATMVINEKGLSNATIQDITSRAGVSLGSFYSYFKSKESVVLYSFQNADQIYEKVYRKLPQSGFFDRITSFVRLSSSEYEKNGKGIIKAITSLYFVREDVDFYSQDRILIRCLAKIVEDGIEEGSLSGDYPFMYYVRLILIAMMGSETMWCFEESDVSLSDIMEEEVTKLARGMMGE